MKLISYAISALSLIGLSANATEQASAVMSASANTCKFVHHWSVFKSFNGDWDVSISKGRGASHFYTPNCQELSVQNTATSPMVMNLGGVTELGFGYENPTNNLTYFVTAVPHVRSAVHSAGDPVPVDPNPTPTYGKKCVFIIDASVPSNPGAYVINYNNAECDFYPGGVNGVSQFVFR